MAQCGLLRRNTGGEDSQFARGGRPVAKINELGKLKGTYVKIGQLMACSASISCRRCWLKPCATWGPDRTSPWASVEMVLREPR